MSATAVPALPDVPEVGSLGKSPPPMGMRLPTAPHSPTATRSPPSYGRAPGVYLQDHLERNPSVCVIPILVYLLYQLFHFLPVPMYIIVSAGGYGFPAAGSPSRPLPSQPPFKAFIGNLPHAVEERDIGEMFSNLKVLLCLL